MNAYCGRFYAFAFISLISASITLAEIEFSSISPVSNGVKIVVSFDPQVTNLDIFSCADIPAWNWNHVLKTNINELTNGLFSWVETNLSSESFFVGANADIDTDEEGVYDGFEIYVYQTDAEDPDTDDDGIDDFHDPEPTISNNFAKLSNVSFSGSGHHVVQADSQLTNFYAPQYFDGNLDGDATDTNDHFYPVCYTRNSTIKMGAEFIIDPAPSGVVFIVKGDSPGSLDIPVTTATLLGNTIIMPPTDATNALANEIDLMNSLTIDWSISHDDGTNWYSAGISSNMLYVTWTDPVQTNPIETFLHVGCESSDGVSGSLGTNDDAVLSNVWTKLQTKDISRASDGFPLTYYGFYDVNSNGVWNEGTDIDMNNTSNCTPTTAEGLITNANGQCHSWVTFINEVMKAQGLSSVNGVTNKRVSLVMMGGLPGFAIKNWAKGGASGSYWIIDFYAEIDGSDPTEPGTYQAADDAGVPAQGNSPNAPSSFQNHWIVKMENKYYDPSYAIGPFTDRKDYENAAFDGGIVIASNSYVLVDLPANNSNPTNHSDEICDYLELDYE